MALYKESELAQDLKSATDHFQQRIRQLRAGRVRADMFEEIPILAYGMTNPLKGVASIDIRGPLEVVIQPWDPNLVKEIYKTLRDANLGFTPVEDGNKVRINMPPMTGETRKQTVKELGGILEESKVTIRNIRRKHNDIVDGTESVSDDEKKRSKDEIQRKIDAAIDNLDTLAAAKEKELEAL